MGHIHTTLIALAVILSACKPRVEITETAPLRDPSRKWQAVLEQSLVDGKVDYDHIAADRRTLERYVAWIGEHGPELDSIKESKEDKRLAFLINAYNASVIYGVLRHEPKDSVHELHIGRGGNEGSFFTGEAYRVDGEWVSLHHLKDSFILARYEEPLLHMALAEAAVGSPTVLWWSNRGLQQHLKSKARAFINSEHGLRKTEDGWSASSLFERYRRDFTDWSKEGTLCAWIAQYAEKDAKKWLLANEEACPLTFFEMDWSLNRGKVRPGTTKAPPPSVSPRSPTTVVPRKDIEEMGTEEDEEDTGEI